MSDRSPPLRTTIRSTVFDVAFILFLSVLVSTAQFSIRRGRAVLSADSLQYLDNAEAILLADAEPSFGYRKPGYSYLLAGLIAVFGPHIWPIVAAQYAMQSLLPLTAYALGRCLRSRGVGWLAALLITARLQDALWAERIMSEVSYTLACSVGVVLVAAILAGFIQAHTSDGDQIASRDSLNVAWNDGFRRCPSEALLLLAGVALAIAWFIRPVAVIVLASAAILLLWQTRKRLTQSLIGLVFLLAPSTAAWGVECALNARAGGLFRPCTGTLGAMVLMRARHMEDFPPRDSSAMSTCLRLLPERSASDAYRVNHVDVWIARDHAMREHGLSDWEIDRQLGQAGWELILRHPREYVMTGLKMFMRTLLRQTNGPAISRVPTSEWKPIVEHPAAGDDLEFQEHWYAYWSLPQRSLDDSLAFYGKWQERARTKAPVDGPILDLLRGAVMTAPVADATAVLRGVGSLWPGFAILLCGMLGLNRRVCAFLAICYLLDALLVGALGASEPANARYQWVWIVPDTTLAAALFTPLISSPKAP